MKKELTIIILTYNSARTIRACLDSLITQINQNFKVLIVDDDSTDTTLEIVQQYKQNTQLEIEIVRNGSHNIPTGRNIGLRASDTDFVAFMDSDDYADSNWVESILKTYNNDPTAAILSGFTILIGQNIVGQAISTVDKTVANFFGKWDSSFSTANSSLNKSVLKEQCFFDEDFKFSEDRELASRIRRKFKFVSVHDMKIYQNSRSSFSQYTKQMYKYGTWRVYYGYAIKDYRLVDFVPLGIILLSIIASICFKSFLPFLTILLFSLAEAAFVVMIAWPKFTVSVLTFPAWLVKNIAWSAGIVRGITTLLFNKKKRNLFIGKRVVRYE